MKRPRLQRFRNWIFRPGVLGGALLLIVLASCHSSDRTGQKPLVATVGTESISRESFDRLFELSRQPQPFKSDTDTPDFPPPKEILAELVKEALLIQELEDRGLSTGAGNSPRDVLATDLGKDIHFTDADLRFWFDTKRHLFSRKTQIRFLNAPQPKDHQAGSENLTIKDFFTLCQTADDIAEGYRRWGDIGWHQAGHVPWWPRNHWSQEAVGATRPHHWPEGQNRLVRAVHFRPPADYAFDQVTDQCRAQLKNAEVNRQVRRIVLLRAQTTPITVVDETLDFVLDPATIARTEPGPPLDALDPSFEGTTPMIRISGGTFTTGSTDAEIDERVDICRQYVEPALGDGSCERWKYEDEIQRRVTVRSFLMDRTEVSWEEYQLFVEATRHRPLPRDWSGEPGFPVANVSLEDAQSYCRWKGKRLPTADEWEFAARGIESRRYPWSGDPPDGTRANFCDVNCPKAWRNTDHDDGFPGPSPIGSFPDGATPDGLLDMGGNIREWTSTVTGDRADVKGGGFFNAIDDLIAADVRRNLIEVRDPTIGFRCAKNDEAAMTAEDH